MVSTKPIEYTSPLGSYQSTFEIGAPNGILLTVDVTATPFISFTDKSGLYTIVRGADPVIDDDLATKRYADSLIVTPQYWDRNAVPPIPILFPLTAGDAVKIDAPGYLELSLIQNSAGNITVDMPWAMGSRTLSIGNTLNAFTTYLTVDGSVSTDSVIPLNTPGVLNLLYDSVTALGDGVSLVSAMIPGALIFIPTGAVTDFTFVAPSEFVGNVEFLSGLVNLLPIDYTTVAVPVDGDIVLDTSLATNERLGFYDGITTTWKWAVTGPAGLDTEIQFNDGGVLGTDALFVFDKVNNHLGIGTATPGVEIQVETGANLGAIVLTNNNCAGFGIGITPGGVATISQAAVQDLAIFVNAHQSITIFSTGEVTVGLNAAALVPARDFHIHSTNGFQLTPCALPAGAAGDICIDSGAANALKYHNGVGWVTPGVTIGGSDTHVQYNNSGALAGTDALVWDHVTNRLGVNVPGGTPQHALHLADGAGSVSLLFTNTTTGHAGTDGLLIGIAGSGSAAINHRSNKDLKIYTNATERITIKNDGKIGFGIAAPASNFHFDVGTGNSGGIHITNNATSGVTSSDGVGVMITAGKTLSIFNLESTFNSFMFGSTAADEKVRVYSTGKTIISDDISGVTVGATIEKLWLDDSGRNSTCIQFTNDDTGHNSATDGLVFGIKDTAAGEAWINQREAQDFEIWTNNTKRVVFASNGAVGINSATPTSVLDVGGSFGWGLLEVDFTTHAGPYTISAADPYSTYVFHTINPGVADEILLPAANTIARRMICIKNIDQTGGDDITITCAGADTFDDGSIASITLGPWAAADVATVIIQSNGTDKWYIISRGV